MTTIIEAPSVATRLISPRMSNSAWRGAGIFLALAALEVIPRLGILTPANRYPPLSAVLGSGAGLLQTYDFWMRFGNTVLSVFLGTGAAFVVGLLLGLPVGTWRPLYRVVITTLDFLRGVPPVALIPVIVLLMPVGQLSQTLLAAYSAMWVIFFQVVYGRRSINPTLRDTAAVLHLTGWERFRYVIWPSLLPNLVTGARIGVSVSLALVITAGLVMGGPNLGFSVMLMQNANNVEASYALIFIIGLLGLALNVIVQFAERRLLSWHVSIRGLER